MTGEDVSLADLGGVSEGDDSDSTAGQRPARGTLEDKVLELGKEVLPWRARQVDMPVIHDHCWWRIAYDNACRGQWDDVVSGSPAYEALSYKQLFRAWAFLCGMSVGEPELAERLNERSLIARGELEIGEADHVTADSYWEWRQA